MNNFNNSLSQNSFLLSDQKEISKIKSSSKEFN